MELILFVIFYAAAELGECKPIFGKSKKSKHDFYEEFLPIKLNDNPFRENINQILTNGTQYVELDIMEIKNDDKRNRRAVVVNDLYKWDDGIVPYSFDTRTHKNLSDLAKIEIEKSMEHISNNTCIKFVPRTNEINYILFTRGLGCASFVGNVRFGERGILDGQDLSIGASCVYLYVIVHEILHALGFIHEHTRLDRDKHIYVNYTNVKTEFKSQIDVYTKTYEANQISTLNTPYDKNSVMHYDRFTFTNKADPDTNTVLFRKDFMTMYSLDNYEEELGNKVGLSEKDIDRINQQYNCPNIATTEGQPLRSTTPLSTTTTTSITTTTSEITTTTSQFTTTTSEITTTTPLITTVTSPIKTITSQKKTITPPETITTPETSSQISKTTSPTETTLSQKTTTTPKTTTFASETTTTTSPMATVKSPTRTAISQTQAITTMTTTTITEAVTSKETTKTSTIETLETKIPSSERTATAMSTKNNIKSTTSNVEGSITSSIAATTGSTFVTKATNFEMTSTEIIPTTSSSYSILLSQRQSITWYSMKRLPSLTTTHVRRRTITQLVLTTTKSTVLNYATRKLPPTSTLLSLTTSKTELESTLATNDSLPLATLSTKAVSTLSITALTTSNYFSISSLKDTAITTRTLIKSTKIQSDFLIAPTLPTTIISSILTLTTTPKKITTKRTTRTIQSSMTLLLTVTNKHATSRIFIPTTTKKTLTLSNSVSPTMTHSTEKTMISSVSTSLHERPIFKFLVLFLVWCYVTS